VQCDRYVRVCGKGRMLQISGDDWHFILQQVRKVANASSRYRSGRSS
jgi:hypothetical protein